MQNKKVIGIFSTADEAIERIHQELEAGQPVETLSIAGISETELMQINEKTNVEIEHEVIRDYETYNQSGTMHSLLGAFKDNMSNLQSDIDHEALLEIGFTEKDAEKCEPHLNEGDLVLLKCEDSDSGLN